MKAGGLYTPRVDKKRVRLFVLALGIFGLGAGVYYAVSPGRGGGRVTMRSSMAEGGTDKVIELSVSQGTAEAGVLLAYSDKGESLTQPKWFAKGPDGRLTLSLVPKHFLPIEKVGIGLILLGKEGVVKEVVSGEKPHAPSKDLRDVEVRLRDIAKQKGLLLERVVLGG